MNNLSKAIYIQNKFAHIENKNRQSIQETISEYNKLYKELFVKGENKFLNKHSSTKSKVQNDTLKNDTIMNTNAYTVIDNKKYDIPKWKRNDLSIIIPPNYHTFYGSQLVERKENTNYNTHMSFNIKMKTKKNGEQVPVYGHDDFYDVDYNICEK